MVWDHRENQFSVYGTVKEGIPSPYRHSKCLNPKSMYCNKYILSYCTNYLFTSPTKLVRLLVQFLLHKTVEPLSEACCTSGHTGMTTTTTTKKTATGLTRSLTITPLPTDTESTRRGGRRTDTGGASTHDVRTEEGGGVKREGNGPIFLWRQGL